MVKRTGSRRNRSRSKFSKSPRQRGKLANRRFMAVFNPGDKVALVAEPSVQKGLYYPRFHGVIGVVVANRGRGCQIEIDDQGKK